MLLSAHRQETKIGRTVNSCRKLEGEAGELANILIDKWKSLVPPSASSESESDIKSFSSKFSSCHISHIYKRVVIQPFSTLLLLFFYFNRKHPSQQQFKEIIK